MRGLSREETEMDGNYMFLCGVMWCKFGQQEAAKELLRAANSGNERTGLGDVGKRCATPAGFGKTGANQFSHRRYDRRSDVGRRSPDLKVANRYLGRIRSCYRNFRL